MRAVLIATAAVVFSISAGAQQIHYYPADPDHLFLWTKPSDQAVSVMRAGGRWKIDGTYLQDPVWERSLARIAGSDKPSDDATAQALDRLISGQAPEAMAAQRPPDAHVLFINRGDTRLLFVGSSLAANFEVPFDKSGSKWKKTLGADGKPLNIPLVPWLDAETEAVGAEVLAKALADVQAPAGQDAWADFWNDVAISALGKKGYRARTYAGKDGTARWLLVEDSGTGQMVFDRVWSPMPAFAVPLRDKGKERADEDSERETKPGRSRGLVLAFLAGLVIGAGVVWLVHKFVEWRYLAEVDAPPVRNVSDAEVNRFADALRPLILQALTQPAPYGISKADLDVKLRALAEACNESVKTTETFRELECNPQKGEALLDSMPERLRKTAAAVAGIESLLTTANATLEAERRKNDELQKQFTAAKQRKEELEHDAAESKPKLQKANAAIEKAAHLQTRIEELEMERDTAKEEARLAKEDARHKSETASQLAAAHQNELQVMQEQLGKMRSRFGALGSLGERFQDGQMNHYSAKQNGPAAAMLGFLVNHSLHQLGLGISADRSDQQRYMLLNLEKIASSLGSLQGYRRAQEELQKSFERAVHPAEEIVKRASERGEAPIFQFALRYLRESVSVDLAPYYFYVDGNGSPYRAA